MIGESLKNNRPLIKSGIGGNPIPSGAYRAELVAGGRIVRRLNVRVG